jgi:uncharacterized protein (TIGR03437 family)
LKTHLARILIPVLGLAPCLLLQAAVPSYFTTTAAGSVPPVANAIAAKQYLNPVLESLYPSYAVNALAYDGKGNLYYSNGTQVWRLNADGTDTLIAGIPVPTKYAGDGGPATLASLPGIFAISFDGAENLYIAHADQGHNSSVVRKVTSNQNITTVATLPSFYLGVGMAVDAAGNVYVTEEDLLVNPATYSLVVYATDGTSSNLVLNLEAAGQVAVGGSYIYFEDFAGLHQWNLQTTSGGGVLVSAAANVPDDLGLAAAPDGTAYFVGANGVEAVSPTGTPVTLVAGSATSGYSGDGGPATAAQVTPDVLAVNPLTGDLAIGGDYVVRVVSKSTGIIQTVAGAPHSAGDNGPAVLAQFGAISSGGAGALASDLAGNLYILDQAGSQIRKISPAGIITTVAGSGVVGNSGDGGKATEAAISAQTYGGVTSDAQGNLFFLNDGVQNPATGIQPFTVRKVDTSGNISTVAGGGTAAVTSGVPAQSVSLAATIHLISGTGDYVGHNGPSYLAADPAGNFYICYNNQILKVDTSENLTVFAGVAGKFGHTPDAQMAATSLISACASIAGDIAGNIYFQDGYQLRKVNTQGQLATVAGDPTIPTFGNIALVAGPAASATIGTPEYATVDAAGNIYFFCSLLTESPQIAMVDPSGNLTPIAGQNPGSVTAASSSGDGGNSLQATFTSINGMAVGPSVNGAQPSVYVLDGGVYIRQLSPYDPANPPPFLSAGGVVGAGGSVPAVAAVSPGGLASIFGANFIGAGMQANLQSSDLVNGKVPTQLAGVCASFGGTPAAMFSIYPGQINVQVPALPPGPVTVQVTLNCGEANAVTSNLAGVVMQTASPEFFSFLPNAAGQNPIAAINAVTSALVGAPGLLPGAAFVPAKPGEIVEAFGTGWGLTTPAFGLGVIPGAAATLAAPYSVTFGGATLPSASILYAGAAPCCAGLYQLDFKVPATTTAGNQTLVITVGGTPSPPQAFVDVQ